MGEASRALALRGAAAALREAIGAPMWDSDRIWENRTLERVRATLGSREEDEYREQGRGLSLEAALDLAMAPSSRPEWAALP